MGHAMITVPEVRDGGLMKRLDATSGRILNPNEGA